MWTSPGATTLQCNTSASLAAMLEKEEMFCYRRHSPNKVVPLAEYIEDRRVLIVWCNTIVDQGNFRSPNELVQVAMALADKYMSIPGLCSYTKTHYQLIVVACLRIAIKVDSPIIAMTNQELSELCRGEYTREEIESEEMCVLHALAWYVNPPTASQIADHILASVKKLKCAQSEWDWAVLVDRVHLLIKASVLDLGLSTQMRPSTLALASILVSTESLRDPQCRKAVLRSILSVTNRFDFTSPSEIDIVRTDLTFLQRYSSSQASDRRRKKGTNDQTNNRADVTSSQPPRHRNRAGAIGPTTYRRAESSSSSESSAGFSSETATQSSQPSSESEGGS